ncbi:MAG: hypothetical protein BIFFINMI_04118 [Phycisphaerae bacterium]|nr:hypothetical protein [Phycisphaerae bacterium]
MARFGSISVPGKSGAAYKFAAYTIDTTFNRNRPAVYLVTRRRQVAETGGFRHHRLALNQTDDLRRLLARRARRGGVHTANCICVHPEPDLATRLAIRDDLRGHRRA